MKRLIAVCLGAVMLLSCVACGENQSMKKQLKEMRNGVLEKKEVAEQELSDEAQALLDKLGDSYDSYAENRDAVYEFYEYSRTYSMEYYTSLQEYATEYYKCVAQGGIDNRKTWDPEMKEFEEVLNQAMREYYDSSNLLYDEVYEKCGDLIDSAQSELDKNFVSTLRSDNRHVNTIAHSENNDIYKASRDVMISSHSAVYWGFFDGKSDIDVLYEEAAAKNPDVFAAKEEVFGREVRAFDGQDIASLKDETIGADFKETMDYYEIFFKSYCDYLKAYDLNTQDPDKIREYESMISMAETVQQSIETMDLDSLSEAELEYYQEVTKRVNQMLEELE